VSAGKDKIRLYGVDAPEKTQSCNDSSGRPYACGVVSLEALKERVGSRPVRCEVREGRQQQQQQQQGCILIAFCVLRLWAWCVSACRRGWAAGMFAVR
jgi:hypothetical protein